MTREELLKICKAAGEVGKVAHTEFADFIIVMKHKTKRDNNWVTVENPYMAVDGRMAMAAADHARQGKKLDFERPEIVKDDEATLTLGVRVVSEIYGTRYGTATSKKSNSGTASEWPWETAETSAIGRALGMMGYGLLPGSGLASADDMKRVAKEEVKPNPEAMTKAVQALQALAEAQAGSEYKPEAVKQMYYLLRYWLERMSSEYAAFVTALYPDSGGVIENLPGNYASAVLSWLCLEKKKDGNSIKYTATPATQNAFEQGQLIIATYKEASSNE